jgi:hypothetical protein
VCQYKYGWPKRGDLGKNGAYDVPFSSPEEFSEYMMSYFENKIRYNFKTNHFMILMGDDFAY